MIVVKNDGCIFFDCDDTLVMWDNKYKLEDDNGNKNTISITDPYHEPAMYSPLPSVYELVPHDKHIQYLKDSKIKNKNTIVVWSAGGYLWAEAVVKALGIEEYVDAVMTKPYRYVDDLPAKEFMGIRIYKDMK